ncbi:hypothetical protein LZ642_17220, partial [Hafnia paralvei]|nr:hypothetical protein [Hafnia paralvei]
MSLLSAWWESKARRLANALPMAPMVCPLLLPHMLGTNIGREPKPLWIIKTDRKQKACLSFLKQAFLIWL